MSEDPIIFVCEHGATKSVIAAAHFNRLAEEQCLEMRAIARGTIPDLEISEQTIQGLSKDGLAPIEPAPKRLSLEDTRKAQYLVSFCELPAEYTQGAIAEQWDDIPAMSENYERARDDILERLHQLVSRLKRSS